MDLTKFRWQEVVTLHDIKRHQFEASPLRDTNDYSVKRYSKSYDQGIFEAQNRIYKCVFSQPIKSSKGGHKITGYEKRVLEKSEYDIMKLVAGGDELIRKVTYVIFKELEENAIPIEYRDGHKVSRKKLIQYLKSRKAKKATIDFVLERIINDPDQIVYTQEDDSFVHKRYAES